MPKMGKLTGLLMLGGTLAEQLLLRRLLFGLAGMLALAVITGSLIAALTLAGLYLGYRLMLEHGAAPDTALLATGGAVALILAAIAACGLSRYRMLRRSYWHQWPGEDIGKIGEAFVEGLMAPPK